MKKIIILFCLFMVVAQINAQTNISGRSQQHDVSLSTASYDNGIPSLSAKVQFSEPNGNNLLDAYETSQLKITITNSGSNSAYDVGLTAKPDNSQNLTFSFDKSTFDEIKPNQSVTSILTISANGKIDSSSRIFNITFSEHGGFIAAPINFQLQTQQFQSPKLAFVETGIEELAGNKNNIIEPGELILATVLIQNQGQGVAHNVNINISGFQEGALIATKTQDYPTQKNLGDLQPGQSYKFQFAFSVTWNYAGSDQLPLQAVVSESLKQFGGSFNLGLQLKQVQIAALDVKETGTYQQQVIITPASLTSDVDKNIPKNAVNPNRFALVIGNEHYVENDGLAVNVPYAINDAVTFKEYAINTLGVPENQIIFLTDATSAQLKNGISTFIGLMAINGTNREFYFYYAGHGFYNDNKDPYLMPVNVKQTNIEDAFKLAQLYTDFAKNKTKLTTVFLDACFSGGGRGNDGLVAGRTGVYRPTKNPDLNGSIVVFAAADSSQAAKPLDSQKHGLFTYYLLKKMQETNGNVNYGDLEKYLNEKVRTDSRLNYSVEQTPQVKVSSQLENNWQTINFKEK